MTRATLVLIKRRFREARRRAAGKPHDSVECRLFEKAQRELHHAGEMLRKGSERC